MLEDELSVSTRDRDGVAIIDLVGDVTTFAEEKINNAYTQVTNQGARHILMNFRWMMILLNFLLTNLILLMNFLMSFHLTIH